MFDGIMRSLRRKPRVVQARFDISTSGEPEIRFPSSLTSAKLSRAQKTGTGVYEFETSDTIGNDASGRLAIDNAGASYGSDVSNENLYAQYNIASTADRKVVLTVRLKQGANNVDPASLGRVCIWIHYDGAP
jgi:hypothetical protein